MRIFKLYNKAKPTDYVAYVTDWEVARESLAITYSAFSDATVTVSVNGLEVRYKTLTNTIVEITYGMEPIDLLTQPEHL